LPKNSVHLAATTGTALHAETETMRKVELSETEQAARKLEWRRDFDARTNGAGLPIAFMTSKGEGK
jgi:hypothetical protein